jgi:phenylpyruvate tautomerase PptA (4-oxalocrotonate tautomerase family)
MPIVRIEISNTHASELTLKLADVVHVSMVDIFNIPANDRNVLIRTYEPQFFQAKPPYEIYIEVTMFAGRKKETKAAWYKHLVEKLHAELGITPEKVFMVINDQPLENWGVRGGQAASDINIGFKIDV